MQTEIIAVTGMTCGVCSASVTKALQSVKGVSDVSVSLSAALAKVQYDEQITSLDYLKAVIKQAGYGIGLS